MSIAFVLVAGSAAGLQVTPKADVAPLELPEARDCGQLRQTDCIATPWQPAPQAYGLWDRCIAGSTDGLCAQGPAGCVAVSVRVSVGPNSVQPHGLVLNLSPGNVSASPSSTVGHQESHQADVSLSTLTGAKAMASRCDAAAAGLNSGCGTADVASLRLDLNALGVPLDLAADTLKGASCAVTGSGASYDASVVELSGTFNGTPFQQRVMAPANTQVSLGPGGMLLLNEQHVSVVGNCVQANGAAIRLLVRDPTSPTSSTLAEVLVGWVSTIACKLPSVTITHPLPAQPKSGEPVYDHATVSGAGPTPTGKVRFYVCEGPATCDKDGQALGSASLDKGKGTARSADFKAQKPGMYCFRAEYEGDDVYLPSSDSSPSECIYLKGEAQILTRASPNIAPLGSEIFDTAFLSGNAGVPQGTVKFYVCPASQEPGAPPRCASGGTSVGEANVDSRGLATSQPYYPRVPGTYCFRGEYLGSDAYFGAVDSGEGECFTVLKAVPAVTSVPHERLLEIYGFNFDNAVVTGNFGVPTGQLEFFVCGPLRNVIHDGKDGGNGNGTAYECPEGEGTSLGTADLDGRGIGQSPGMIFSVPGVYCFRAEYHGDATYEGASDHSQGECFNVKRAVATTSSAPSNPLILVGDSVYDIVTVTGNYDTPTGYVSFYVCNANVVPCTSYDQYLGSAYLQPAEVGPGAMAWSPSFTPPTPGRYCFATYYGGDNTYEAGYDMSLGECFLVKAPAHTKTTPSNTYLLIGDSVHDHAEVTGGWGDATGTVTFHVCGPFPQNRDGGSPPTCPSNGSYVSTNDLAPCTGPCGDCGGEYCYYCEVNCSIVADSDAFTPQLPGRYCFRGEYSGDSVYAPSMDATTEECFTVVAPTTTVTTPSVSSAVMGNPIWDDASVRGDYGPPTGYVYFSVCWSQVPTPCYYGNYYVGYGYLDAEGSAQSPYFYPYYPGVWCFSAYYYGDQNYQGSQDYSTKECVTVQYASQVTTSASPTQADFGSNVYDTATIATQPGYTPPTGTVNFFVCGPGAASCFSGGAFVGASTLNGQGSATSPPFHPDVPGAYCFRGEYSGDGTYAPGVDKGQGECFTVLKIAASLTTTSTPVDDPGKSRPFTPSTSATDTANVPTSGGAPAPTGSVTFFLCQPAQVNAAGCVAPSGLQVGSPVSLNAAGSATSASTTNTAATGKYCWRAEYSGDAYYTAVTHTNALSECFTIEPASSLRITKVANVTTVDQLPGQASVPVTYTYNVTNTGTAAEFNITVSDDRLGFICAIASLTAGQSAICTASTGLTATTTNIGTATGRTALGTLNTATASATVTVNHPNILLTMSATPNPIPKSTASTITYTIKNTGDVTLNTISVIQSGATVCTISTLAPGITTTCTRSTGALPATTVFTATASGKSPLNNTVTSTASVTVTVV